MRFCRECVLKICDRALSTGILVGGLANKYANANNKRNPVISNIKVLFIVPNSEDMLR